MNVTMIDNYDSFTFNLVQYLMELGVKVTTYRNDTKSAQDIVAEKPDAILISPGPSTPDNAGVSLNLVQACAKEKRPLVGVCLGHQSIGQSFGGKIVRANVPHHGKVSPISHTDKGVFKGLPNPFEATRYHSLVIDPKSLPEDLEVTAQTKDGTIMGIRHKNLPIEGVQFHPESVLTISGKKLLANFLNV